jgi:hypothetical protein
MKMGKSQQEICDREVNSLLEKSAIEPTDEFISGLFLFQSVKADFSSSQIKDPHINLSRNILRSSASANFKK